MPELPLVLVTEGSDATPLEWLKTKARVIVAGPESSEFAAALPDAVGMVVRTYTRVNPEMLAKAPKLKVVGRGGVGIENIDAEQAKDTLHILLKYQSDITKATKELSTNGAR